MENLGFIISVIVFYILINWGVSCNITKYSKRLSRTRIFWSCCILSPIYGVLIAILDELIEVRANTELLLKEKNK